MRAQIDEQVAQEASRLQNLDEAQLKAAIESRRAEKLRQYHLDESLPGRVFWRGIGTLGFDFGNSTIIKASDGDRLVITIILEALPRTIVLFTSEVVLVTILGVILGLYAARKPNGLFDRTISLITMITNGLPAWWLAMIAIMAFSYASRSSLRAGCIRTPRRRASPASSTTSGTSRSLSSAWYSSASGARPTSCATSCSPISRRTTSWPRGPGASPSAGSSSAIPCAARCQRS